MERNKVCGIYKITSPTKRIYIGQSINIKLRWKTYLKEKISIKSQPKLYNSFLKYKAENHIFEIIEECTIEQLNEKERFWQDHYNVLEKGLNCVLTSTKTLRVKISEETREKLRKGNTMKGKFGKLNHFYGRNHTEETKNLIALSKTGKTYSQVTKDKLSKLNSGRNNSMFGKTGLNCPNSKIVLCTETGIFYESISEASKIYSIKHNTLSNQLNGVYKNKTNLILC